MNLTKWMKFVDNTGVYITPLKMGKFNTLAAGAVALSASMGAAERSDAQEITPINYELPPSVEHVVVDFQTCVGEVIVVTTPEMIPDDEVRKSAFSFMVGQCEGIRDKSLNVLGLQDSIDVANTEQAEAEQGIQIALTEGAAARESMRQRTDDIINGAKAQIGL